jgi:hypothetical protein
MAAPSWTPSPIEAMWLSDQFDKLHKEHVVILGKLDDILKAVSFDPGNVPIIPELEEQIKRGSKLASSIDQKVPDQVPPVPPGSTTPPGPTDPKPQRKDR